MEDGVDIVAGAREGLQSDACAPKGDGNTVAWVPYL